MLTVRSIAWYLISDGIWQSEFYNPCGNFADSQLVPYSVLLCHLNYEIQALHCLLTWPSMRSWDLVIVWWVKNHAKPRSYLAYSRNKTWPWKIMEQTITMKNHKANLTKLLWLWVTLRTRSTWPQSASCVTCPLIVHKALMPHQCIFRFTIYHYQQSHSPWSLELGKERRELQKAKPKWYHT